MQARCPSEQVPFVMGDPLLQLRNLSKTFRLGAHSVRAVDGVSVDVIRGECLAIVGESGSGKSTVANMILGILPPDPGGEIRFKDEVLPVRRKHGHRRAMQLVQQNPLSSLNPKRSIGASIRLALDAHRIGPRSERPARVRALLEEVGLSAELAPRPPSALSGGQRQRVAIARALACESELVVLDEPTSALDVLVQARVLALLSDLRARRNLTYAFITHDLSVVRNIADRIMVMEKGRIVETEETVSLFRNPRHICTRRLIGAVPVIEPEEIEFRERVRAGWWSEGDEIETEWKRSDVEPTQQGPVRNKMSD